MVALEEVRHFSLTELGVAMTTSRSGSTQREIITFSGAVGGSFKGKDKLL
jgi:hypothetical protein